MLSLNYNVLTDMHKRYMGETTSSLYTIVSCHTANPLVNSECETSLSLKLNACHSNSYPHSPNLSMPRHQIWSSEADLCDSKTSLVKVRVAVDPGNLREIIMHRQVPNMSNAIPLKTIILDNCVGLEQVVPDVVPQSLVI